VAAESLRVRACDDEDAGKGEGEGEQGNGVS
jgi:hypothetical protein